MVLCGTGTSPCLLKCNKQLDTPSKPMKKHHINFIYLICLRRQRKKEKEKKLQILDTESDKLFLGSILYAFHSASRAFAGEEALFSVYLLSQ